MAWVWSHRRDKWKLEVPNTSEKKSSQLSRDIQGGTASSAVFVHVCVCCGCQMQNKEGWAMQPLQSPTHRGLVSHFLCTPVKSKHTERFCKKGVELTLTKAALSPLPAEPSMPQYKLTYFNLRGRAEISRYLFAYSGKKYEDHRIEAADWPKIKPSE